MKCAAPELLEQTLGYKFTDQNLLARALTHASASKRAGGGSYERLEFLGDRVLGLIVADMLDTRFPDAAEGELSRWFHRLVSGPTCTDIARELQLDRYLRTSGGRPSASVLGDACESVLGAIYRDGGLDAARAIVERYWLPRVAEMKEPPRDPKMFLQEWGHKQGLGTPTYTETERSGPDHALEFEVEARIGTLAPERGRGRSKREAEQVAATAILRREGAWEQT